jgi:hypothetical protein
MIEAKPAKRVGIEWIKNHKWVKAMQHEFAEQSGVKQWNEQLLKEMGKVMNLDRKELIWRI